MISGTKLQGDMTLEEVKSLYFAEGLIASPITLRRLDTKAGRSYFTVTPEGRLDTMYTSVTTLRDKLLPIGMGLVEWFKNKTPEQQEDILRRSSAYGTAMDILNNKLLIDKAVEVESVVSKYLNSIGMYMLTEDYSKWIYRLKKDVMSFKQFVLDYEVVPLLVSSPVCGEMYGVKTAGTLDLYCDMNNRLPTKTITPHRITTVLDYKAKIGDFHDDKDRSGFYDGECLQLIMYRDLLCQTFPDIVKENIQLANWSPKNWKTTPSYNLKIWTETAVEKRLMDKLMLMFDLYAVDHADDTDDPEVLSIPDVISLYDNPQIFRKRSDIIEEGLSRTEQDPEDIFADVLAQDLPSLMDREVQE